MNYVLIISSTANGVGKVLEVGGEGAAVLVVRMIGVPPAKKFFFPNKTKHWKRFPRAPNNSERIFVLPRSFMFSRHW